MINQSFDIIIIGSGMGGSALAYGLRHSGASILVLERGERLPVEPENWSARAVSFEGRYSADESWVGGDGRTFRPRIYYNVGGNTKIYGAAMLRYRQQDFTGVEHAGGRSEPWPIRYADLAPYYDEAERLLGVHGVCGEDPTEPPRGPYAYPPLEHEPEIARLAERLVGQGLRPFHLPVAVHASNGDCIRCATCDGFPCRLQAKGDAECSFLDPALQAGNAILWTGARVTRLALAASGSRIDAVEVVHQGTRKRVTAGLVVLAAGAINSAALLLQSATARFPRGLANSSDQVGRNYMAHNNTVLMAVNPLRPNPTRFQKTLAINDFYGAGEQCATPLGHIQMRGKVLAEQLRRKPEWIKRTLRRAIAGHSVDLWLMSEDLPDPENRVRVDGGGRIRLDWRPNNVAPHGELVRRAAQMMRRAGYPILFTERRGVTTISHQCGTVRFGTDPAHAVLDPWCRSYDHPNLFVVDTGFYPSSAAVNPALTLAAQALRVAAHIRTGLQ